jgi:hypothetical protein
MAGCRCCASEGTTAARSIRATTARMVAPNQRIATLDENRGQHVRRMRAVREPAFSRVRLRQPWLSNTSNAGPTLIKEHRS